MQTPPPANINALKNILAKSKAVMAAVEEKSPTKKPSRQRMNEDYDDGYRNQPIYDERDEREPEYKTPQLPQSAVSQAKMYTPEQIMASKLPANVKEAMLKTPIPQLQMPPSSTFSLADVEDLVDKPAPKRRPAQINEGVISSNTDDMITVSRSELKNMINEAITQFFTQAYNKNLTEAAIKQTINTLIKEGKINVKKK